MLLKPFDASRSTGRFDPISGNLRLVDDDVDLIKCAQCGQKLRTVVADATPFRRKRRNVGQTLSFPRALSIFCPLRLFHGTFDSCEGAARRVVPAEFGRLLRSMLLQLRSEAIILNHSL